MSPGHIDWDFPVISEVLFLTAFDEHFSLKRAAFDPSIGLILSACLGLWVP